MRSLMSLRFWELLINDSLIRLVFVMANMLSAATAGLVGAAWAHSAGVPSAGGIGVLAFVVGFILSTTIMIVLDSAVATSYVVWAEDPAAMMRNRPEHYQQDVRGCQADVSDGVSGGSSTTRGAAATRRVTALQTDGEGW